MLTCKKSVLIAVVLLTLLYLLRPSQLTSINPPDAKFSVSDVPSRSYPPPIPPKSQSSNQQPLDLMPSKPLRERLRYQFPYDLESKFPAYIWQTWKHSPSSGEFGEDLRPLEASWTEEHPGFVHEVVTDDSATSLIKYLYASVPEVPEAYASMPLPVLKADFFRYLILLARGGIYSDIDTRALKPTTDWLPEQFDRSTVGLMVGIEADAGGRADWNQWYSRMVQFCQWTIQSKPGHPALRDLVATITEDALRMKKMGILKANKMDKKVMEFTGPAVFTDAIFSYLNNKLFFDYSARKSNITAREFSGITSHKKVGDVVVLPITSFSPGVEQMGAKGIDDPMAFVKHEFSGMHLLFSSRDMTAYVTRFVEASLRKDERCLILVKNIGSIQGIGEPDGGVFRVTAKDIDERQGEGWIAFLKRSSDIPDLIIEMKALFPTCMPFPSPIECRRLTTAPARQARVVLVQCSATVKESASRDWRRPRAA